MFNKLNLQGNTEEATTFTVQHGPWPAGHADADGTRGQDRRRLAGAAPAGAHSPRHVAERLGHHGDHDPAAHSHIGQRAEPKQRRTTVDPPLGHGQHPRQRGHPGRHEGRIPSRRAVLPPATKHVVLAALRRGRLPQRQEPELVDWAMEKVSDDEDDAPMPDLIDMPPAPASAPRMSNLEGCIALRLVYGSGPR